MDGWVGAVGAVGAGGGVTFPFPPHPENTRFKWEESKATYAAPSVNTDKTTPVVTPWMYEERVSIVVEEVGVCTAEFTAALRGTSLSLER